MVAFVDTIGNADVPLLVQRAHEEPAVREILQAWSRSGERDLAWSARLALREVDRTKQPFARKGLLDAPGWSDLRARL